MPENTNDDVKTVKLTKTRQELVNKFLSVLKSDEPMMWKKGWEEIDIPHNAISKKDYRGVNRLLLSLISFEKGYTDARWCTFKQANDSGWRIKKGEKAVPIEYWFYYDKSTKKHLTFEEYKNIINENPEKEKEIHLLAQEYYVFNGEQIEGIPPVKKKENTIERIDDIEEFINNLKTEMDIDIKYGGNRAFYIPSVDEIHIPLPEQFFNIYEFYATQLHEIAHATGHEKRLNRNLTGDRYSESYASEELRAEISSCFIANDLKLPGAGKEHNKNHAAYVSSWISKLENDPSELMRAIKDADKITSYIEVKGDLKSIIDRNNKAEISKNKEINKKVRLMTGIVR